MCKGLKSMNNPGSSKSQTRNILKYMISFCALVAINREKRKSPQTLDQPRLSAGLRLVLLFVFGLGATFLYSGFIPAKLARHAHSLITELSTGKLHVEATRNLERRHVVKVGTSLREMLKTEPHFEVVKAKDNNQVYLATLSRNGISVSEEIPHHIFDDDIPDHELANFWFKVRRRLSSNLRSAELT